MAEQVICVENIGPRETRKRLVFGLVMAVLAVAAGVWLLATSAPRLWRLGLFLPLWSAAVGYLQARERT